MRVGRVQGKRAQMHLETCRMSSRGGGGGGGDERKEVREEKGGTV